MSIRMLALIRFETALAATWLVGCVTLGTLGTALTAEPASASWFHALTISGAAFIIWTAIAFILHHDDPRTEKYVRHPCVHKHIANDNEAESWSALEC